MYLLSWFSRHFVLHWGQLLLPVSNHCNKQFVWNTWPQGIEERSSEGEISSRHVEQLIFMVKIHYALSVHIKLHFPSASSLKTFFYKICCFFCHFPFVYKSRCFRISSRSELRTRNVKNRTYNSFTSVPIYDSLSE